MKWALAQLRKLEKQFTFDYEYDLMANLVSHSDILDVKKCHISGTCNFIGYDEYLFNLSFDIELLMQCAVSLEPVNVPLNFRSEVRFSYCDDDSTDDYLIEKDTIDLDKAVLSEIVLNIPYRVVKPGYEDMFASDEDIEEDRINPSFQALKDLYGGEEKWSHHSEEFQRQRKEWDAHI